MLWATLANDKQFPATLHHPTSCAELLYRRSYLHSSLLLIRISRGYHQHGPSLAKHNESPLELNPETTSLPLTESVVHATDSTVGPATTSTLRHGTLRHKSRLWRLCLFAAAAHVHHAQDLCTARRSHTPRERPTDAHRCTQMHTSTSTHAAATHTDTLRERSRGRLGRGRRCPLVCGVPLEVLWGCLLVDPFVSRRCTHSLPPPFSLCSSRHLSTVLLSLSSLSLSACPVSPPSLAWSSHRHCFVLSTAVDCTRFFTRYHTILITLSILRPVYLDGDCVAASFLCIDDVVTQLAHSFRHNNI